MNKSTILRQITMLKLIPKYPAFVLTKDLYQRLIDEDFKVSKRTVERDLDKLSDLMGLRWCDSPEGYKWAYINHARELLPALSPSEALLLLQAKEHLQNIMPMSALQSLEPRFDKAESTLSQNQKMAGWKSKLKVMHGMVPLITPKVPDEIREQIYDAVLKEQQVIINYQKNSGVVSDYILNAHGLIIKDYVQYLVASKVSSPNILQLFKLSQIKKVDHQYFDNLSCSVNIADFLNSDVSGFLIKPDPIKLKMKIAGPALQLLSHSKLSTDQSIHYYTAKTGRDCGVLTATVELTYTLIHFLLGYGKLIEVVEPQELIDEIKERNIGSVFN
ncbi:MAG: WYL domain-containing protein [Colwellia sp.]|nr:WYL domain-containing protein [Colwellia sp.]